MRDEGARRVVKPSTLSLAGYFVLTWVVCSGLAACGTPAQSRVLPAPSVTIGVAAPLATLNPVTMGSSEETNFGHFVWAGLLGIGARGRPFPMLAAQVPMYKNGLIPRDGHSITFNLRRGLHWSTGRPITAKDIRFGWQLATRSWADVCPATCPSISNVRVDSTGRVTFLLRRPFSPVLFDLPPVVPRYFIWKGSWRKTEDFLFKASTNWFGTHFPVDGPFEVSAASGASVTFTRNPRWRLLKRPAFGSVRVTSYSTDTSLLSAVEGGTVDVAQGFDISDIDKGILSPRLRGLSVRFYPTGGVEHFEANLKPNAFTPAYLRNPKVRQALSLVINRVQLLEAGLGLSKDEARGLVAYSAEMPGRFDGLAVPGVWDPIKQRFVTHPEPGDAARLLTQAGWTVRDRLRYRRSCAASAPHCTLLSLLVLIPKTYIDRIHEAQYLQCPWGKTDNAKCPVPQLGIKTRLNYTEWSIGNLVAPYDQNGPCARGEFDLCLFAQLPGYDPQTDFQDEFTSSHAAGRAAACHSNPRCGLTDLNYPRIHDKEIDHIFAAGARSYDLTTRARLYRRWQVRVAKEAYWIPLYYQPLIVVQRRPLHNFDPSSRGAEWNPWALAP